MIGGEMRGRAQTQYITASARGRVSRLETGLERWQGRGRRSSQARAVRGREVCRRDADAKIYWSMGVKKAGSSSGDGPLFLVVDVDKERVSDCSGGARVEATLWSLLWLVYVLLLSEGATTTLVKMGNTTLSRRTGQGNLDCCSAATTTWDGE
jgi:hypothetical protein